MKAEDLKLRTKQFALRVLRMSRNLPKDREGNILAKQLIRSATSVGANYRAACRARSTADFLSKIRVAEEEADESLYWIELITDMKLLPKERIADLATEANELTAIFTASGKTARRNAGKPTFD